MTKTSAAEAPNARAKLMKPAFDVPSAASRSSCSPAAPV